MRVSLAICFVAAVGVARAEPACDTSTDAAARKAYSTATGNPAPASCFERSRTFDGLVTVGDFANDRGCIWRGVLYECRWNGDGAPAKAIAKAMAKAGWAKASDARRWQLARAWITEVEHLVIVDEQPAGWPNGDPKWSAPSSSRQGNRTRVRFWQRHPAGMLPQSRFSLVEIVLDGDGVPGPIRQLGEVTIGR